MKRRSLLLGALAAPLVMRSAVAMPVRVLEPREQFYSWHIRTKAGRRDLLRATITRTPRVVRMDFIMSCPVKLPDFLHREPTPETLRELGLA